MTAREHDMVFEDDFGTLEQASFCGVPGYLVLRVKTGAHSLSELELEPEHAHRLGALLASAVAAVERAVGADRVYVLSFCEVDRNLHFHLFPRTAALLAAYHQATGTMGEEVDGPRLFAWAREAYPAAGPPPPGFASREAVAAELRELLPRTTEDE